MTRYIELDTLVAEIENLSLKTSITFENFSKKEIIKYLRYRTIQDILSLINTLEVKELDLDNYNKVKRTLSLSFMNFLDANCPEGKMCLSNGECFDIDKAFDELDFAKLFRYMEKYFKTQKEIN